MTCYVQLHLPYDLYDRMAGVFYCRNADSQILRDLSMRLS